MRQARAIHTRIVISRGRVAKDGAQRWRRRLDWMACSVALLLGALLSACSAPPPFEHEAHPLPSSCNECLITHVWASAMDDAWFSGRDSSGPLVLRWDGTGLTRQELPPNAPYSLLLWGTGPNDVWAYGDYVDDERSEVLRWDGARWEVSLDLSLGAATLTSLVDLWGSSADNVWLVGDESDSPAPGPFALRWNGAEWTRQDVPFPEATRPVGVWTSGPDDVWIAGHSCPQFNCRYVLLAWDGSRWNVHFPEQGDVLEGIRGSTPRSPIVFAIDPDSGVWRWNGERLEPVGPELNRPGSVRQGWVTSDGAIWTTSSPIPFFEAGRLSRFDGTQWTSEVLNPLRRDGVPVEFHSVWAASAREAWVADLDQILRVRANDR